MTPVGFGLYSPRRIAKRHWHSVPESLRRRVHLASYLLGGVVALPVVLGWAQLTGAGLAGLTAAVTAFGGLLFGLAIQVFGFASNIERPRSLRDRSRAVRDAHLLGGLLANVLYCTLWTGVAALSFGASAFIGWLWVERGLLGLGVLASTIVLLAFMLTVRRLYDVAQENLNRALEFQPQDSPVKTPHG